MINWFCQEVKCCGSAAESGLYLDIGRIIFFGINYSLDLCIEFIFHFEALSQYCTQREERRKDKGNINKVKKGRKKNYKRKERKEKRQKGK